MNEQSSLVIGLIGGSGLYGLDGLKDINRHKVETPFGDPSGEVVSGKIGNVKLLFLPRHGTEHTLSPADVPYRANIWAMKALGAHYLIGASAVGALTRRNLRLGDFVLPDQAFTRLCPGRPTTFFIPADRVVVHVNVGEPFCNHELRLMIVEAARQSGVRCHSHGKYVCIPGPEFSTGAESEFFRQQRYTTVGMTNFPENVLARQACLPYVAVQMVTDYDNLPGFHLSSDAVVAQMVQNAKIAKQLILALAEQGNLHPPTCACTHALDEAIATLPQFWSLPYGRDKVNFLKGVTRGAIAANCRLNTR